jgi:hypothetical protein
VLVQDVQNVDARSVSMSRVPPAFLLATSTLDALAALPRLSTLALTSCGLRTLPQLAPLASATSVISLSLAGNAVAALALLPAYVRHTLPQVCAWYKSTYINMT